MLRRLSLNETGCHMPTNGCVSSRRRRHGLPPPAPVSPSSCFFRRRLRCSQHAADQPEKLPWGLRLRDGLVGLSGREEKFTPIRAHAAVQELPPPAFNSLSPVKRACMHATGTRPTSTREEASESASLQYSIIELINGAKSKNKLINYSASFIKDEVAASFLSWLDLQSLLLDWVLIPMQYEGGAMEGGRGPSIWDTFTHQHPGTPICFSMRSSYAYINRA